MNGPRCRRRLNRAARAVVLLLMVGASCLGVIGGDPGDRVEGAPAADLRFGCDPGPALPPAAGGTPALQSEPILPPATEWLAAPEIATVKVGDRQHLPSVSRRPIDGVGFNLEHA